MKIGLVEGNLEAILELNRIVPSPEFHTGHRSGDEEQNPMREFGKGNHDQHQSPAEDMNGVGVLTIKGEYRSRPMVGRPVRVGVEISGQERQRTDDDQKIIGRSGNDPDTGQDDPTDNKENGDGQQNQGHPVRPGIRHGPPFPFKPAFFPEHHVGAVKEGDRQKANVKDVSQDGKNGVFFEVLIGREKPADDGQKHPF